MSKKEEKEEKEVKVLTIRDFKVMIEGMDMVLGDDWYPTEEQWKRIRGKIDNLIVSAEQPTNRLMYPVVNPGQPTEASLLANFPEVPVATDIPIGEVPAPTGSALTPPALTPPAPTPPPETTVVDGEAVKVHKPGSFV